MGLEVSEFAKLRPFLFHLTSRENIRRIKGTWALESAERLLALVGRLDWVDARRVGPRRIVIDGEALALRDQDPLHDGAIAFEAGWNLGKFVSHLNRHVFFWPGSASGPINYGRNHFERYAAERPLLLRIGLYQLIVANASAEPLFCRFNSGAPRVVGGRRSPRGPSTFQRAEIFAGTPSDVVEVVFQDNIILPQSTQIGESLAGPWQTLSSTAV
jgi:hypothetical protein